GVGGVAIKGEVTFGELALRPGVWDLFDQDHDVRHECASSSSKGSRSGRPQDSVTIHASTRQCYSRVTLCGSRVQRHGSGCGFRAPVGVTRTRSARFALACLCNETHKWL